MADINVERKSPSIWPWIVGLLVLALLIWAIAELVDTDEEREIAEIEEVEEAPGALPAPIPEVPTEGGMSLGELEPLGAEDIGSSVQVSGQVVGQPTSDGFWLLTDTDDVLFVMSAQQVTTGEQVRVSAVLETSSAAESSRWLEHAKLKQAEGWELHRDLHLHVGAAAPTTSTP